MNSFPGLRTIPSGRRRRVRRVLAAAAVTAFAVTVGCGGTDDAGTDPTTGEPAATVTRTTTVTATTTTTGADPTTVTVTADPGTTGTVAGARPTVADLERDLIAQIESRFPYLGPGELNCEATGVLADWQPVWCTFLPDAPFEFGALHVSMLDGGRYGWANGECCDGEPWADDYPSGMYCRDLRMPPPDTGMPRPESYHLNYGLVVYYWLTEGRPDRMDADHDGIPCETVYPADEVTAFWDSVRVLDATG
ncbi:MAG: hypothetical protein ACFCVF_05435 [Kineosporiaceae bacterium]